MKYEIVPTGKIKIGRRYRGDVGDVEGLAQNIREMGLLQPVGLDRYYNLIFGFRRLWACKDILGWKTTPAVILDVESLIAGEYAENEFRKQFTPSERTAIGKAIEEELGNRQAQGRPKKVSANAETYPRGNTVDLAAKRAGFTSAETYGRATTVTEKGVPALVEAMDKGTVSISAAAAIASQPKEEQERIVELPIDEQREVVRQIRKTKADQEADERRAFDVRVFGGLANAVEQIAEFHRPARETWEGLSRVSAYDFSKHLSLAIACLVRLEKEHPNVPKRPGLVTQTTR